MFLHLLGAGVSFLIGLALLVALVVLIVKLAKGWRPGRLSGWVPRGAAVPAAAEEPTDSALRILSERLAKGEIEVDDYYARRTALKGPDPHRPQPSGPEQP